jgi:hypothetical protein
MSLKGAAITLACIVLAAVGMVGLLHFAHSADDVDLPILVDAGALRRIEILDHDARPIWRLIGAPGAELSTLTWGQALPLFRQEVPAASDRPRPLVSGERVTIICETDTYSSRHEAVATGPAAVRGGFSEAGPRQDRRARP